VLLLEARNRVGGRIWTQHLAGWPHHIELGAEFIHGGNDALWSLIKRARAKRSAVSDEGWFIEAGGKIARDTSANLIEKTFESIGEHFRGSFGDWLKQSGKRFLSEREGVIVTKFIEGFQTAPLDRMSARTLFASTKAGAKSNFD
jgi:hypothetical protein